MKAESGEGGRARPQVGDDAARRREEADRRLAEALRENLVKRKRQSRARSGEGEAAG
jgi:hypothetical protein